jgi:hypothetical protein
MASFLYYLPPSPPPPHDQHTCQISTLLSYDGAAKPALAWAICSGVNSLNTSGATYSTLPTRSLGWPCLVTSCSRTQLCYKRSGVFQCWTPMSVLLVYHYMIVFNIFWCNGNLTVLLSLVLATLSVLYFQYPVILYECTVSCITHHGYYVSAKCPCAHVTKPQVVIMMALMLMLSHDLSHIQKLLGIRTVAATMLWHVGCGMLTICWSIKHSHVRRKSLTAWPPSRC